MRKAAASIAAALALAACSAPLARRVETPPVGGPLRTVRSGELCVTDGRVEAAGDRMEVTVPEMRAVVADATAPEAELAFVYEGPSSGVAPLANGEVRRQIGLKLRAQDTCNVVYVMWRVEPESKIAVQVKHNPGKSRHAQCRDGGYQTVAARSESPPPVLTVGERHVLHAAMTGTTLVVQVDGRNVWEGDLGEDAIAFAGPVGLRSDNGRFAFELAAAPNGESASCASLR